MKPGDIVTIYEDPFTKTKPEGDATLVKLVEGDSESETWVVRFIGESGEYTRNICGDLSEANPAVRYYQDGEKVV